MFGNTVISKLIETNNNSEYLIRYLDDVLRPLVLILPKMGGYAKNSKSKDGDKDKNKNNKLIYFRTDNNQPLKNYICITMN